jgi:hypothetical protein
MGRFKVEKIPLQDIQAKIVSQEYRLKKLQIDDPKSIEIPLLIEAISANKTHRESALQAKSQDVSYCEPLRQDALLSDTFGGWNSPSIPTDLPTDAPTYRKPLE